MRDDTGGTLDRVDGARVRDLLYPRLVTLIQIIDESAAIAYPRALHRRHLPRILVFLIGLSGRVTSSDLVFATGYEKAQISRGLKELAEGGLIDRPEVRGWIGLNTSGRALFEQIMIIARERDTRLRQGFEQADIQRFLEMTGMLIERVSRLIATDESCDDPGVPALRPGSARDSERPRTSINAPTVHDLFVPALRSLMVYVRRSGTGLFRREVGLTNLEWRLLSLIAENVPISLSTLIPLAARDKSQIARAVKRLNELGLVRRHDEGRVNVALELTADGAARHARVLAIGERQDDLVFSEFRPDQHHFYKEMLDGITRNAIAVLAAEKAQMKGRESSGEQESLARYIAAASRMEEALDRLRAENQQLRRQLADALEELSLLRK